MKQRLSRLLPSFRRALQEIQDTQELKKTQQQRDALLERERLARIEAEEANARLEILAQAGLTLSRSLNVQATLADLAQHIVAHLAEWCIIDLLQDDGTLNCAVLLHSDSAQKVHSISESLGKYSIPPKRVAAVLNLKKPQLFDTITDELLDALPRTLCVDIRLRYGDRNPA